MTVERDAFPICLYRNACGSLTLIGVLRVSVGRALADETAVLRRVGRPDRETHCVALCLQS